MEKKGGGRFVTYSSSLAKTQKVFFRQKENYCSVYMLANTGKTEEEWKGKYVSLSK